MKYRVSYSNAAIGDLDRVWNEVYAASKSMDITNKYIDDLLNKVEAKADYPKSGSPLYYQDNFMWYYFVVFKAYIAFYRIEEDIMLVDRVLFGRSDYMKSLKISVNDE